MRWKPIKTTKFKKLLAHHNHWMLLTETRKRTCSA